MLLLFTAVFASGALLTKFNLEALGNELENRLAEHVGAEVSLGEVYVDGLRGLVIDNLGVRLTAEGGPEAHLVTPKAHVRISLVDLLYGRLRVERIKIDESSLVLSRPAGATWYDPEGFDLRDLLEFPASHGFRVTGQRCSLEVRNVVGGTDTRLSDIGFDIARMPDAQDLTATITGQLSGDASKAIAIRLSLASFDDFDIRLRQANLTAEDVNVLLPSEHHFVQSGAISPTVWVSARPSNALLVSVEAPFEELLIRDQPEFIAPATGRLTAQATYTADTGVLRVTAAKAESDELSGGLEGQILFEGEYPAFDIRLEATKLPIEQLLDHWGLAGRIEDYGATELRLNEPQSVVLALQGTSDAPELVGEVFAASGRFVFAPESPNDTTIDLELGQIEAAWNSNEETLSGRVSVLNGTIENDTTGMTATQTRGTIRLIENKIVIDPLNANIREMPFSATAEYDVDTKNLDATFSGVIAHLEDTAVHDMIRDTLVSGDAALRQATIAKRGNRYQIRADVDASQTGVQHDWWYEKAPGIGATGSLTVDYVPNTTLSISVEADVASTAGSAEILLVRTNREQHPWRLDKATAESERIDVAGLGQCLNLPYRISGGTGHSGRFSWERDHGFEDGWRQLASASFDEIQFLPIAEGANTPMAFKELSIDSDISKLEGDAGVVTLNAGSARMPNLSEPWLLPFDMTPPEGLVPKVVNREWQYFLSASNVVLPPWSGTDFSGEAFSNRDGAGFTSYGASVGEGQITGTYDLKREDNFFVSSAAWQDVPAETLIEHLGFPNVLRGTLSGGIDYRLDKDDPGTLRGKGTFRILDGQFSADYVASLLQGQTEGELSALPPSLRFSQFNGEFELDGDMVKTPSFVLLSDDLSVEGNGDYIREGDMDYQIKVALSPATAEGIPALRDNLNLQGYKLSNRDIELAFRLSGPTFNPKGRVEEMPPVGVTLVSGITTVTSSVLDFPRKILVDLLKMGGGMLGAGK